jgi:hypothetical protein
MEKITTIGLDLAKSVFQVHAVTKDGHVAVRRTLRRSQVLEFFDALNPAWLVSRLAGVLITGRTLSVSSDIRSG